MSYKKGDLVGIPTRLVGGVFDFLIGVGLIFFSSYSYWSIQGTPPLASGAFLPSDLLIPLLVSGFLSVVVRVWSGGSTLGQLMVNAKVIDKDGESANFGQYFGRWFVAGFSAFLWLGYICALFTERKQTLHDMAASTIVVPRESGGSSASAAGEEQDGRSTKRETELKAPEFRTTWSSPNENFHGGGRQALDEEVFAAALDEFESEKQSRGLYARLYSENSGDMEKVKAQYIKIRAQQIREDRDAEIKEKAYQEFLSKSALDKKKETERLLVEYAERWGLEGTGEIELSNGVLVKKEGFFYRARELSNAVDEVDPIIVPFRHYSNLWCLKAKQYQEVKIRGQRAMLLANGNVAILSTGEYLIYEDNEALGNIEAFSPGRPVETLNIWDVSN